MSVSVAVAFDILISVLVTVGLLYYLDDDVVECKRLVGIVIDMYTAILVSGVKLGLLIICQVRLCV